MPIRGLLVVLVILAALVAGWFYISAGGKLNPSTVSRDIIAEEAGAAPGGLSFDIVRIDAEGKAVISGHATAGAKISLHTGKGAIAEGTANERGEWVIVVDKPMGAGPQEIDVTSAAAGGVVTQSREAVIVDYAAGSSPLAVLMAPQRATRILQRPDDQGDARLSLGAVDLDEDGTLYLSGRAAPKMRVRLYLDNETIGIVTADGHGFWTLKPDGILPGAYTLRADQLGSKGAVTARVEIAFERGDPRFVFKGNRARKLSVQRGNGEWRILWGMAGTGSRYVLVYGANQGQSRDPELIYPGQIFEQAEDGDL